MMGFSVFSNSGNFTPFHFRLRMLLVDGSSAAFVPSIAK